MGNMFSDTNLPIIVHPFPAPGDGGQNGQWHFVSTGTSSFNDGKTQYSGTHVHSNVNVSFFLLFCIGFESPMFDL